MIKGTRHFKIVDKSKILFLQLDIMEKFRKLTYKYPSLVMVGKMFMQASEKLDVPIIMVEASKRTMGETAREILEVKHSKVQQFEKHVFSAYADPHIRAAVDKLRPENIILYGLEAHACVLQTTLDLLQNNYNVHLVVDGVSSINRLDRSVALSRMGEAGATFTTSETALLEIAKDSRNPEFKKVLEVIKSKMKVPDPLNEFI